MKNFVACLLAFAILTGANSQVFAKKKKGDRQWKRKEARRMKRWERKKRRLERKRKRKEERERKRRERAMRKKNKVPKRREREERKRKEELARDARRKRRREKRRLGKKRTRKKDTMVRAYMDAKRKQKAKKVDADRKRRPKLISRWKQIRDREFVRDVQSGKNADLYKQPAWPFYATYVKHKHLLNVTDTYKYATDAYSSRGDNGDVTRLAFGEEPLRVQDLLLASRLAKLGTVTHRELGELLEEKIDPTKDARKPDTNQYLKFLADEKVTFIGEAQQWSTSFDLARYVCKRYVVLGVQVPVVYKKHRLKREMRLSQTSLNELRKLVKVKNAGEFDATNAFMRRYGQNTDLFIKDIFKAKGIDEFGGSSTGLGDITVFGHVNFQSAYVDKLMAGLRFVIPTAQRATNGKLWAPELGNGGFFESSIFTSIALYHQRYFNPHIFLQFSATVISAHVDKRVPKKIIVNNPNTNPANIADLFNEGNASDAIAFGERVKLVAGGNFSEFDTTRRGLADNVVRFKMRKGEEFNVRVGNMFEAFIYRRAFLDVYYDVRFKLEDWVSGVDRDTFDIDVYNRNSEEIEHKVGAEWSYQFDPGSRLRVGCVYTFAGRNVPKTFGANVSLNYSF